MSMGLPSIHSRRRLFKSCIVETGILHRGLGALARPDYYHSSIPNEPLERHKKIAADPREVRLPSVVHRGVPFDLRACRIFTLALGIGLGYFVVCLLRRSPDQSLVPSRAKPRAGCFYYLSVATYYVDCEQKEKKEKPW